MPRAAFLFLCLFALQRSHTAGPTRVKALGCAAPWCLRACLLHSVGCSRCVVLLVTLPLPLLQEHLESRAVEFAESEVLRMEVGSRVMHCPARRLTLLLHCKGSTGHMLPALHCDLGSSHHQSHWFLIVNPASPCDIWPTWCCACLLWPWGNLPMQLLLSFRPCPFAAPWLPLLCLGGYCCPF